MAVGSRGEADSFHDDDVDQAPNSNGHTFTCRHYEIMKWKRECGTYTKPREPMRPMEACLGGCHGTMLTVMDTTEACRAARDCH